ncbi:hypothetical protein [Spongorhabdus nitratireducens]
MKLKRFAVIISLLYLSFIAPCSVAMTGFFVAYDKDVSKTPGRSGVVAHLIRITNIGEAGQDRKVFRLHLPEAEHHGGLNRQYLTRLGIVDDNHPVFLSPNGFIYIFDLTAQPEASGYYKHVCHAQMTQASSGCPDYQTQTEINSATASSSLGALIISATGKPRELFSPMSVSTAFKTADGATHCFVASDERCFILDIPPQAPDTATSQSQTINIRPFPAPGSNKVCDNPQTATSLKNPLPGRRYMSTGIDLVKGVNDQYHIVASLDATRRETKAGRQDDGRAFILYQTALKPGDQEWKQTNIAQASARLRIKDHEHGDREYKNNNFGDIFDVCTDTTCRRVSLSMHHHQGALIQDVLAVAPQDLRHCRNLMLFDSPQSRVLRDSTLSEKDHDEYRVMTRPFKGRLYSVTVGQSQPSLEEVQATAGNYEFKLQVTDWPEPSDRTLLPPASLIWTDCCTVGTLPTELHPHMLEHFILTDSSVIQLDYNF